MADKTPVRVVFNSSNVATGMAEFQSGETVGVANGGTGLSSIGSAGQVLKVNAAGNALVFAGEGDLSIQNLVAPSNADLTLTTSGTGSIVLNDLTIADNSISTNRSNDDLQINASGTGTVILENLKIGTSGSTVTTILDEDNMSSDSATSLATQQSIKAYVDSEVGAVSTTAISQLNSNVTVADSGSGTITVTVDASTIGTFTSSGLQLGGSGARVTTVLDEDGFDSNSNTSLATQQSIKAYVDAQITAEDLDFQADSGGALSIDLDSETFTFTGGTGIDTSGSGNAVTFAIDSTVATLTGSQTLTNKTITSPTIATPTITGGATIGEITTNLITSNGSNADISIQPSGTGDVLISGIRINGTTLDSSDSSTININENVIVDGTLTVTGALDFSEANLSNVGNIGADQIFGDGDTNTSITFSGSDVITIATGGATAATFNADQTTSFSGAGTFAGIVTATSVTANDFTSNGSNADITIAPQGTGDINLTAGADVNIPSGIGLTFGDDAEKIEGDGTDLTISGNNINLTAVADVNIPSGVGLTFATAEKIESDGTDLTITVGSNGDINIPANIGLTFGNDGEKIEGDGTDLTITGNLINLTAATAVVVPSGIPLRFVDDNEKITSNGTDLTINSGADINLTATADVNIPANVGITFGNDAEKIEGDGTDLTISGNNIKLTAATDVIIPTNVGLHFTDANEKIESDGSKLTITSGGTAFNLPTADGDENQALITDGAGTLSFGSVGDLSASDDSLAKVVSNKRITSTARTVDAFGETFQDSVLYYIVSNDHHLDVVNVQKISLCHNDTGPFISSGGVQSGTGSLTTFSAESSNNIIRLKAASTNAIGGNLSFYKFGLGDNSTAATSGNIIVSQNTDVDSGSESIVSFAHATFRGAKLFVSVNNNSKTEVSNFEALVVHDGTEAFISQGNAVNSGNNDLLLLTAAIDGSNVVISGAGLEPNLRVTVHAIMLKDTMVANAGSFGNAEAIAPVTVSSTATEFDTLEEKTTNGAVYYLVSKNASAGEYAINEIFVAIGSNNITHASTGFISTKGTNQLAITTEFKDDTELQGSIKLSSTDGASTTVSGYLIKLHAS